MTSTAPKTTGGIRSPRDYTPKHLADKILLSKSALEGERKQVTVMFADVKGSMELAEQLDPEEWHKVLDRFFAILTEGVHRFEGTVNQYTGDGIMALFGAPIAHEDHAQRACHAALRIRDSVRAFSDEVRRAHGVDFEMRIGLNSGEVVVGKIGDDLRMDYTAQGLAVGLAQRMEALARDSRPCLTQYTAKLVDGFFELDDLGEFKVKGVEKPLTVFALIAPGAARTRIERSDWTGLSAFIGRDLEMETLKAAFAHSEAGRGQVIGIVAEPGLGKSRLLREFSRYIHEKGGYAITIHNPSHSKDVPLSSFLAAMRDEFRIVLRDTPDVAREKVKTRFAESFPASMEFYPLLCDFLGVPDPTHPLPPMTPEQRQRRLQEFQERNLKPRTQKECTVMIVEDVHWMDPVSESLIEFQINATPTVRQMCVCTYRPEYTPPSVSKSFYRQMPLLPLGETATKSLIQNLLGEELADSNLAVRIRQRCEGNPFFVEETIQSLAEMGVLTGKRGAYATTCAVDQIPFPATVQAVLDARIDRLADDAKQIIQTASVIGRVFPRSVLQSVVELDDGRLDTAVNILKDSEFIFEESRYPDIEYSFKHALTQDAAYRSQLTARRESLHGLVARTLENHFSNQLDEKAALIAQHWAQAGETLSAARWHRRAAEWAARVDVTASAHHWRCVRKLSEDLPGNVDAARLGIAACSQLLNWGWREGIGSDEAQALHDEGHKYAELLSDRRADMFLRMTYTRMFLAAGDTQKYLDSVESNWKAAEELEDLAVQANAWQYLPDAYHWAGRFRDAIVTSEQGLARFPRNLPASDWAYAVNPFTLFSFWRGLSLVWVGRLDEGLQELGRTLRYVDEDGTPEMAGYVTSWSSQAHYYALDPQQALASARRVEDVVRETGESPAMLLHLHFARAHAYLAASQAADAIESARAGLEISRTIEKQHSAMGATILAEALLQAGRLEAAAVAAAEAIELCKQLCRRAIEIHAHGVMARVLLQREGASAQTRIEAELAEADALLAQTGAQLLAPAVAEWRAELADVLGEDGERKRLLAEALKGFEQIGAIGHVQRLETKMRS